MQDRTVLVVEDDPAIRGLIAELLDDAGYTALLTDHGQRGVRLAEDCAPSVVVVNQSLRDMSGLDVLERLRRRRATRHIPVVLISGRTQQLGDGASGADRILPMPFDIDALLTHVQQLAGGAGARSRGRAAAASAGRGPAPS